MAQGEATLIVRLIDKASAGLKGVSGGLDALKRNWIAVTGAIAGATAVIATSLRAFAEQELAVNKLNQALKNQGLFSKTASQDLLNFASALQKTTTFSDETIIGMQALLTTFGLAGQPLKDTTKAALDLATGLGIDLRTATLILGKAAVGETSTLARYGIKISENIPVSERFAAVLDQVNARFSGAAVAATNTYAGQVEQLKNKFNDLQEMVGEFLLPVAQKWASWIGSAIDKIQSLTGAQRDNQSVNQISIAQLSEERAALREKAEIMKEQRGMATKQFSDVANEIRLKTDLINKLKEESEVRTATGGGAVTPDKIPEALDEAAERERQSLEARAQQRIESEMFTAEQLKIIEDQRLQSQLIGAGLYDKAVELNRVVNARDAADAQKKIFGDLATFKNSKSKEMAAVGKSAAVAQATIDTYSGASGAFKALAGIPIVGPALATAAAAAAIAAGLGRVAAIQGVPLAHGGVVLPTGGGTIARIGEAGGAEAVIPLDDRRASERIRESIGGGDTHITINVGTLTGDRQSAQELARVIDEELYRMGRNRKSLFLD